MEIFEYYIKRKEVVKQKPNPIRAKSLVNDAEGRLKDINLLDMDKFPKLIFENVYDALRDLCDAILLLDGWKSYSHEASISYLLKKGFDVAAASELDRFRYKRNGSKYYGEKIGVEEARSIKEFYFRIRDKLRRLSEGLK